MQLPSYLVQKAKRSWEGRLLIVYVEVLQVKRDVQNLNLVFMVQWWTQVERLLFKSRAVHCARCKKGISFICCNVHAVGA